MTTIKELKENIDELVSILSDQNLTNTERRTFKSMLKHSEAYLNKLIDMQQINKEIKCYYSPKSKEPYVVIDGSTELGLPEQKKISEHLNSTTWFIGVQQGKIFILKQV